MADDPKADLDLRGFVVTGTPVRKTVALPLLDGPREVDCLEDAGTVRVEGDIVVRPVEPPTLWERLRGLVPLGHGVNQRKFLWDAGVVPYVAHSRVEALVAAGIAHWMAQTPIRFVPYGGEADFVSFEAATQNDSPVGRQGGMQVVNLIEGTSVGWAVHEIGHALGLWHEHSRSDQAEHIRIHKERIIPGYEKQFTPQLQDAETIGAYDYASIMHYPETAFGVDGQVTISRIDGGPLGPRHGLSPGDVDACRHLYPELDWA